MAVAEQLPELAETGFSREEVYELAFPFNAENVVRGLYGLAGQVAAHATEYDLLVGEDTSGRLATLVMRSLINQRREEHGAPPIQTRFANAHVKIAPRLRHMPDLTDTNRTLVVTEYTHTGNSIFELCDDLKLARPNVPIDIGAVTSTERATRAFAREELPRGSRMLTTVALDTQLVEKFEDPWPSRPSKGVLPILCDPFVMRTINFDKTAFLAARQSALQLATRFNVQLDTR